MRGEATEIFIPACRGEKDLVCPSEMFMKIPMGSFWREKADGILTKGTRKGKVRPPSQLIFTCVRADPVRGSNSRRTRQGEKPASPQGMGVGKVSEKSIISLSWHEDSLCPFTNSVQTYPFTCLPVGIASKQLKKMLPAAQRAFLLKALH